MSFQYKSVITQLGAVPIPRKRRRIQHWRPLLMAALLALAAHAAHADDSSMIDSMDTMTFNVPHDQTKARVEVVPGKIGQALKFSFDADAKSVFAAKRLHLTPEWDTAAGFSFWVKGDGSNHLGGMEFIWNDDYGQRYGYAFPINNTDWKQIFVSWHDLVPESGAMTKMIDAQNGNAPSKLVQMGFGKWWYWKDYAAHSYTIDDIELQPASAFKTDAFRPQGNPLARVQAKLKAGQPITIVTMGDSLTDYDHWSNKTTNWPTLLKDKIKQKYGSDVTIINPAMGGTDLRQNLVVLPRWTSQDAIPDLVTVFFGSNDYDEGMRSEGFYNAQKDAVERIRRATNGKADVLILSTRPALDNARLTEMADASRKAAKDENAGLADIAAAYQALNVDHGTQYAWDKVHLSLPGQRLVADVVLDRLGRK